MIVDAFIFYNELDMLEFRLEELNDSVDYFVLVESPLTFSGLPKPLFYEQSKERFSRFSHKIIHVVAKEIPQKISNSLSLEESFEMLNKYSYDSSRTFPEVRWQNWLFDFKRLSGDHWHAWMREFLQRAAIMEGIKHLKLEDSDIVMISDLDEIVDVNLLSRIINNGPEGTPHIPFLGPISDIFSIYQFFYYYDLECVHAHWWSHMKIMDYRSLIEFGNTNAVRYANVNSIGPGGWHFSYFGGVDRIITKIQSFSHQELNVAENLDCNLLQERINNRVDIFGRDKGIKNAQWSLSPFDPRHYWPKRVDLLIKLFKFNYTI